MSTNEFENYLQSEVDAAKKSIVASSILFILLAGLVIGYFQWVKAEVEPFLEPDELAEFTVSEARRNLPAVVDSAGNALIQSLPMMIRDAMNSVMETTLPMLRKESAGWMREQARMIAGVGTGAVSTAFEEVLVAKKGDLLEASKSEPGQFVPGVRLDELSRLVEIEANRQYNTIPEETLGQKLDKGASALRNINTHLKELASKEDLSRKDVLGKRFISLWWSMLKQMDDEESATEKTMGLKVKQKEEITP